eukprot:scaffold1088_cov177-Ochromonas_danica.AAC.11
MSGEDLRTATVINDSVRLKELIKAHANVCSVDEWALTALHYAVWNGHVECVILLVFNPNGVDVEGKRTSVINMRSCIGLTAMHLAAMDCPDDKVYEITHLLLLTGGDPKICDDRGRSAYSIAKELKKDFFLRALQDFIAKRESPELQEEMRSLMERFHFQTTLRREVNALLPIEAPDFVFTKERVGALPAELEIHEHHILPLAEYGKEEEKGVKALACLRFASEQAEINAKRREGLVLLAKKKDEVEVVGEDDAPAKSVTADDIEREGGVNSS